MEEQRETKEREGDEPATPQGKPASGEKMVLRLVRNVNRTDSKIVKVGGTVSSVTLLKEVQQAAMNKFRVTAAHLRLFDCVGTELTAANHSYIDSNIRNGETVYVSSGEACVIDKLAGHNQTTAAANARCEVIVLAKETLVEDDALKQLNWAAALSGVVLAVGLPDLHKGSSCPVGAAIVTEGIIYPSLVGSDIGCGMMLAKTSLRASAAQKPRVLDRWVSSLQLEGPWDGDIQGALAESGVAPTAFDADFLGTVGRGNHFAELQVLEKIEDDDLATQLDLNVEHVYLCVHSGSRGFGESILKSHSQGGGGGLFLGTHESDNYLSAHDHACKWAQVNRRVIARRLLDQLQASCTNVLLDITHNSVTEVSSGSSESVWVHRKGAAPSNNGFVVIPGSRGTFSYLVQPSPDSQKRSGWSLAHGAGRMLARSTALMRGKARHPNASVLTTTALGSRVVCDDKALLYEERPEAYKDAACVIADLVAANLCTVVAILKPVLTYKMKAWQGNNK